MNRLRIGLFLGLLALVTSASLAQPPGVNGQQVELNLSEEVELTNFVEFVGKRLGLSISYDQTLAGKKVSLIVPDPIPVDSLLDVLQSTLKTQGFILAPANPPGWKRIVPLERIPEVARPLGRDEDLAAIGSAEPITRVFVLRAAKPTALEALIRPTMSKNGASIVPVDDQSLLIVTDVAENIRRIEQLIELLDSGKPRSNFDFVPVKSVKAEELAERLSALLAVKAKALGKSEEEGTGIEVSVDQRTNRLILFGDAVEVTQAKELLKELDKPLPSEAATISLTYASPERLDELIRGVIDGRTVRPPYQSRIEGNALIIESSLDVLQLATQLKAQIDTREAPDEQSPIRFYKVKNVTAQELLGTIQSIFTGQAPTGRRAPLERRRSSANSLVPGANYPPIYGSGFGPFVPLAQTPAIQTPLYPTPQVQSVLPAVGEQQPSDQGLIEGGGVQQASYSSELLGDAQVTVDINTNTIIVVAKPEVQRIYASLIEQLDERRPQVLIEAKVVIVDTSKDFTLGVEVSGADRTGDKRSFAFTSFGFSEVNPVNGALQITPGLGFNGTLVDPSTADVVVRALSTHRRARVLSSPRILVNDNAEGELTSVSEVPFTSVNASQTVATTSFAGFAEAGTTITVTPTISDDNYIQLDYIVTLNSFTGDGADGVPPPRQTNELRSRVAVPDGYTVVVGGLLNKNDVTSYRGLPWLEKIPIVRDLTGTTANSWDQTSLFVFLRPVILQDDKFRDLKYISDQEMRDACLPGEFPGTEPMTIR